MEITYIDVSGIGDADFLDIYKTLSEYRRGRIDAYRFDSDKRLSLGVGYLLDLALKSRGLSERDVKLEFGPDGKPYISGGPHFSLSHSGTIAMCAVSDNEVGIDVEKVATVQDGLIRRACTDEERARLLAISEPERSGMFYRLWTAKESYMKLLGTGMRLAPDAICVDGDSVSQRGGKDKALLREYSLPGYSVTACAFCGGLAPGLKKITV